MLSSHAGGNTYVDGNIFIVLHPGLLDNRVQLEDGTQTVVDVGTVVATAAQVVVVLRV
jgi:hypothetical protein